MVHLAKEKTTFALIKSAKMLAFDLFEKRPGSDAKLIKSLGQV